MHTETPPQPSLVMRLQADLPLEDLQLVAIALIVIVAVLGIVFIRSRFQLVQVDREKLRRGPRRSRQALHVASGPCRWRAKPDLDDQSFRAWRCTRCGATRWTTGRADPPGPCR
ncbi:hypothetical protein ACQ5SO_00410 [Rhodovulum sp. DZ06]|uniref:hypothetical protein n=1 Tax=Rhodovulum sp. DZ06 TaxID=3425126 RepID=UPI003D3313E2